MASSYLQFIVLAEVLQVIVATGIIFFIRRNFKKRELVNWDHYEAVILTIGIYFITQVFAAVGLGIVSRLLITVSQDRFETSNLIELPIVQFFYIFLIEALTILALYVFLKNRRTSWSAIGWVRPRFRDLGYALAGFGVYFIGYALIVSQLVEKYLPIDTDQKQQLGFDNTIVGPELIFVFMSLVILPPLVEEILFRGFLFTGLKNKLRLPLAMLVTSVIFAAAHLQWGGDAPLLWTAAIDTFILSMVLVYVRWRSKSLWPSIGIHFIKNGIAFLALFIFKVV